MSRIIFWLLIIFGALFALRLLNVAKNGSRGSARGDPGSRGDSDSRGNSGSRRSSGSARGTSTAMVRCAECGVFLPRAETTDTPRGPTCGDARCPRLARRTAA